MSLTTALDLTTCGPTQLWAALPVETRQSAARALYAHDWGNAPTRREADFAIMQGMHFRETAVRQLPVDRRAGYLARSIRPTDSLASSMLLALHLESRRPMLATFMDALGIPHTDGLIADDHETKAPKAAALEKAVGALRAKFDAADVDLYLACLVVLDRETWGGLAALI